MFATLAFEPAGAAFKLMLALVASPPRRLCLSDLKQNYAKTNAAILIKLGGAGREKMGQGRPQ